LGGERSGKKDLEMQDKIVSQGSQGVGGGSEGISRLECGVPRERGTGRGRVELLIRGAKGAAKNGKRESCRDTIEKVRENARSIVPRVDRGRKKETGSGQ